MHQINDKDVESALVAFSKGNHPSHATLEERMKAALQSLLNGIEEERMRKELISNAITAEKVIAGAITREVILAGAPTGDQIKRALDKATLLYNGPMGLLYSVNNCYHDVAVQDLAKVLLQFHLSEKARKE
jgi:hypothetical protein